jgi:hypothetical protein
LRHLIAFVALLALGAVGWSQPARTFILGGGANSWRSGGNGIDAKVIERGRVDTTNTPGNTIEFDRRAGWLSALFFEEDEIVSSRVLEGGSITSPNAGFGYADQLKGIVNGSPSVAFQRKPTVFEPDVEARGIRVVMDFGAPVGVHRVRFYPRNTVVPNPEAPFHSDFLRGYELLLNAQPISNASPNVLVARDTENEAAVVDIDIDPQYVRLLTLRSLTNVPFEIDEIDVFGTGYLQRGVYLSDVIDLGDRSTIGFVRWIEAIVGNPDFSGVSLRVRTGSDDSPIRYRNILRTVSQTGVTTEVIDVTAEEYFQLVPADRAAAVEDDVNWSQWNPIANGELITAPSPRRYIQFRLQFDGALFDTREVDRLEFDFLQPPIADTLVAEIFPRLARAEERATFRYAVRLRATGGVVRGYDRLEVDTSVEAEDIREVKLDGEVMDFNIDLVEPSRFVLSFPPIRRDGSLMELTFDLPIFRFGSTFSGRVFSSSADEVPQALVPGNAVQFEPGDVDELSDLSVAIPKPQIGKLVGEIVLTPSVLTPNGDGANDRLEVFFNLLQLTRTAPVRFEIFDLSGHKVHTVFDEARGIGPVTRGWDGRLADGSLPAPGLYVWVLRVKSDAFEEKHQGVLTIVY